MTHVLASHDTPSEPEYMRRLQIHGWESDSLPIDNLLRRLGRKSKSEATKRNYFWHVSKLCGASGFNPEGLVRLNRTKAERLVQGYADGLSLRSPRYANAAIISLKAFFNSNGYKHFRELELERYHVPRRSRVRQEYVPTKTEAYRMADSAGSLRDRAVILALFSSGFRNSTLRALLVHDVQGDLISEEANVRLPCYLDMKRVVPNACKGSIEYYSFICDEASAALRLYLEDRASRFGQPDGASPLFASEYNQISREERQWKFVSAGELQHVVKSAAQKGGIKEWSAVHPHSLRKTFETVLHTQMIDGSNMETKTQEVFMGHVLPRSQDNYYDRSKVESMRVLYSKLNFGRLLINDKFAVLKTAAAQAFQGSDLDPEAVILEYARSRLPGTYPR